jgi:hypothetical protein
VTRAAAIGKLAGNFQPFRRTEILANAHATCISPNTDLTFAFPNIAGNEIMNSLNRSPATAFLRREPIRNDPLDEVTGLMWSALLGGAFWLMVIVFAMR